MNTSAQVKNPGDEAIDVFFQNYWEGAKMLWTFSKGNAQFLCFMSFLLTTLTTIFSWKLPLFLLWFLIFRNLYDLKNVLFSFFKLKDLYVLWCFLNLTIFLNLRASTTWTKSALSTRRTDVSLRSGETFSPSATECPRSSPSWTMPTPWQGQF